MFARNVVQFSTRPRTRRLAHAQVLLAATLFASGLGCGQPGPAEEPQGAIQLAITNVPSDVSCVQITISDGLRPVVRKVEVVPMADLTTTQAGLPVGPVSIGVNAYDLTCSLVTATAVPTWVSGTVQTTLVASVPVMVTVNMSRPGTASIGIVFPGAGGVTISPTSHDFGTVSIGAAANTTFTITNATQSSFAISPAFSGANPFDFQRVGGTCGSSVAGGSSCTLGVRFTPGAPGARSATLTAGTGLVVSLTGAGTTQNSVTVTPGAHNYGDVPVGGSANATFVTTNGTSQNVLVGPSIGGSNFADFGVVSNGCTATLAPGQSCSVVIRFAPLSVGAKTGILVMGFGIGADLSGNGIAGGGITISPTSHNYGTVSIGAAGMATFTITNSSGSPVTIAPTFTGANPFDFQRVGGTCGSSLPGGGSSCTLGVRFTPGAPEARSATLSVGAGPNVSLVGTGTTQNSVTVAPSAHNYGNVVVGGAVNATFVTTNGTSGTVLVGPSIGGSNFADFGVVSNGCTASLAPGQSCSVVIKFAPLSLGAKTGILVMGFGIGADLSGNGVNPSVTISPASHDFGTVSIGAAANTTFTISNTTQTTFTISPTFSGANPFDFQRVGGTCGSSLPGGGSSCTLGVRFTPGAAGARSATLTAGAGLTASLTGAGSTQNSVTVAPSVHNYGSVVVGSSANATFVTTNGTTGTVLVGPSIGGSNFNDFGVVSNGCTASLAPGQSCSVVIKFAPLSAGAKTAILVMGFGIGADLSGNGVTAAPITNLVVNDTAATNPPSGDGIPNSQQWSVQTNFRTGVAAFGDRSVTISSTGNGSLAGKAWIRTAADSKLFTGTPVATFTLTGSFLYLLIDDRHNAAGGRPLWLDASYTDVGWNAVIAEGTTLRPYSVWRKPVTSGSTVSLPKIGSATAPCYLVVVE